METAETKKVAEEAIGKILLDAQTQNHLPQFFSYEGIRPEHVELIEEMHNSFGVPRDMIFGIMIGVASVALCGRHCTQLGDFNEVYANLPILILAPSGTGKSPVFRRLTAPIVQVQGERHQRYRQEFKEWKLGGKEGDKPLFHRLFVQDSTIEKIGRSLVEQREGTAVMTDESLFDVLTGYKDKGGAQMAFRSFIRYLDGGPVDISRSSSDAEDLFTPNGILSLCSVTQPSDVPLLFDQWTISKGVSARFLVVYSDIEKKDKSTRKKVNCDNWCGAVRAWLTQQRGTTEAQFHPLEPGAVEVIELYNARKDAEILAIAEQLKGFEMQRQKSKEGLTLTYLRTMYAKQKVNILRLALVLHFLSPYLGRVSICADEMKYAISVMETFEYHAKKTIEEVLAAQPGARREISRYGIIHQAWDMLVKWSEEKGVPMPSQAEFARTFGIAPQNFSQKVLTAKY